MGMLAALVISTLVAEDLTVLSNAIGNSTRTVDVLPLPMKDWATLTTGTAVGMVRFAHESRAYSTPLCY